MIVYAAERRTPVIHGVEEPVLQDQIPGIPDGPHIVRGREGAGLLKPDVGRGSEASGNLAAHDQRQPHDRVDDTAEHADDCEAAATVKSRPIRATPPATVRR